MRAFLLVARVVLTLHVTRLVDSRTPIPVLRVKRVLRLGGGAGAQYELVEDSTASFNPGARGGEVEDDEDDDALLSFEEPSGPGGCCCSQTCA